MRERKCLHIGKRYGYRLINGKLCIMPEEAAVIRQIYKSYINGLSLSAIASNLCDQGIPSPRGSVWMAKTVARIIHNEVYIGTRGRRAIIKKDIYRAAQAKLKWQAANRAAHFIIYPPPLYGYQFRDGKHYTVPEEAVVIRQIYEDYLGGAGPTVIARILNDLNVPTPRDSKWTASTVILIIRREKYTGTRGYEAIIDKTDYDAAQIEIKRRAPRRSRKHLSTR
jgi:DNA invertase Pin-like site-specific DNA recombinase